MQENGILTPLAGREGQALSFDLTGPKGTRRISVEVAKGAPGPLADAINARTAETGVSATVTDDGQSVRLYAFASAIRVDNLSGNGDPRSALATLAQSDRAGIVSGGEVALRDSRLTANAMVGAFGEVVSHLSAQRAEVGALADLADRTTETLAARKVRLQEAVAGLEDLDVAAALTRLQTLLLTEQAAQQSFVKISGTSLFDYLR